MPDPPAEICCTGEEAREGSRGEEKERMKGKRVSIVDEGRCGRKEIGENKEDNNVEGAKREKIMKEMRKGGKGERERG